MYKTIFINFIIIFQSGSNNLTISSTETCLLRPFNPDTLETDSKIDLSGLINIFGAIPIKDPKTGFLYNISATFTTGLKYHFVKIDSNSEIAKQSDLISNCKIHSTIPSRMKTYFSYYHTFGMSENHLVFIEQPWVANSVRLVASRIKGRIWYNFLKLIKCLFALVRLSTI